MRNFKNYRFGDVISLVFIPVSFLLVLHIAYLTRTIHVINNQIVQDNDLGALYTIGEELDDGKDVAHLEKLVTKVEPLPYEEEVHNADIVSPPLNLTSLGKSDHLRFTSIPRAGSTMVKNLLAALSEKLGYFVLLNSDTEDDGLTSVSEEKQKKIVQSLTKFNEGAAVSLDSFAFVNFSRFEEERPIYVSLVRGPVDRAISVFYAARSSFMLVEKKVRSPLKTKLPTKEFLKKSLENCLKNPADSECSYFKGEERQGHTIQFFCGQEPICLDYKNPVGLQKAKENVERYYSVVGLMEDWNKTMVVFEHYVPRYFKETFQTYYESIAHNDHLLGTNPFKPSVDSWAVELLEQKLEMEVDFYQFLSVRLNKQYEQLVKLKGHILS